MTVTAKAPVRIDFGGAWTDVELFSKEVGGVVFNATIDQYVSGVREVLVTGQGAESREGMSVQYGFDLPTGSGLGTSAALNVCWFALIGQREPEITEADRRRIAEQAYGLEELLRNLGGRQDQYAAAFGGFNLMRFGSGSDVTVERVPLDPAVVAALNRRSVLCYTGTPRLSGSIHQNVWDAYRAQRSTTVAALHRLRALGDEQPQALLAGDIDRFASLLQENWDCQCNLDASVSNDTTRALFAAAQSAGALGGKACGAGGGGCLYFVTPEGGQDAVAQALAATGAKLIPFSFEFEGLSLSRTA